MSHFLYFVISLFFIYFFIRLQVLLVRTLMLFHSPLSLTGSNAPIRILAGYFVVAL